MPAVGLRLVGSLPDGGNIERGLETGQLTIGRSETAGLAVPDPRVSRVHASLEIGPEGIHLRDLGSANGTFVNGERVVEVDLRPGDRISLGGFILQLLPTREAETRLATADDGTSVIEPTTRDPGATRVLEPLKLDVDFPAERGVVPAELLRQPVLDERDLEANGVVVEVIGCAAVGGGMGSFVWVDVLRNAGTETRAIAVLTNETVPQERYRRLATNSQIPLHERLRSNSESCPDNIWGFPGYAPREAWRDLGRGNLGAAASHLWSIFGEPAVAQTYTPRAGDVFTAMEREAKRIEWPQMLRLGRVRAIRKGSEGRLIIIASASDEHVRRHFAVSARFVHLAIGYPAIQLLPDLAEYRDRTGDRTRVVNAYEDHGHLYAKLRQDGGTVLLRGRGIVASRIIQRLWEERRLNPAINVVHLHRSRLQAGHEYGPSRRGIENEFEFQAFNWPKGCWTGVQRDRLERASPQERKELLDAWGGTTTANRSDWRKIIRDGLREGWYRIEYGNVREMRPADDGRVVTVISATQAGGGTLELPADFVVDCTGLIASPQRSPLLDDLVRMYRLPTNPLGRLHVTNDFEIEAMRHGDARMYAAGAMTLGGPFATVDSFLGLQYAALRAADAMHLAAPDRIRRLQGWFSFSQWFKWARGVSP